MIPVVTASEMRALDKATIEDIGIPAFTLMETAGRAVAAAARAMTTGAVAVVCGPGNNGGDGFVTARVLRAGGCDATVYLAAPRAKVSGDAATHLMILERAGGVVRMIDTPAALAQLADAIAGAPLVVDALFGVGLARAIDGHFAEVVATINRGRARLALDIPSGLDTDTGRVLGVAVRAHRTVTMAAHKVALAGAPGFAYCGAVEVCDIGVPPGLLATQGLRAGLVEERDLALPHGGLLDHKGTRGHALIVAGMPGMRGAGRLAAIAALRAGAGLVTLAAEGELTADDSIMTRTLGELAPLLDGKAAVVIGPGLGRGERAAGWVGDVLATGVPAVVDADALNLIAGVTGALAKANGPIVITPHPGEAARLLGTDTQTIEADRLGAARALAAQTRTVVVLKGARTIVCDGTLGDDYCSINPTGGPALATGGSGDVLAGVIGALLAQGLTAVDAARAGVYVHGRAGDELARIYGERGVISSDLPIAVSGVIRAIPAVGPRPA
ncbi:MAG TPA: NAD(P)H-hydrate dehydratase [Kofleriaceae bacterium]|nr:NAD(P)H-hydrate dehydratase [Kofleriaceae bacterium]